MAVVDGFEGTEGADGVVYEALRTQAVWSDLSQRGKVKISGRHRVRFLHGMVTHDVKNLEPMAARYTAVVTDTGKVIVDLVLINRGEYFLCDTDVGAAGVLIERLKHFRVAENVEFEDIGEEIGHVTIQGPNARAVVGAVLGRELDGLAEALAAVEVELALGVTAVVMRYSRTGEDGYDLLMLSEHKAAVIDKLRGLGPMVLEGTEKVLETARIEAGIPRWGKELDETTILLEAGMSHALSYQKGCYVGQEALVMLTDRGQPPKTLTGLVLLGTGEIPEPGAVVLLGDKPVGKITSCCESPKAKGPYALAFIKSKVAVGDEPLLVMGSTWKAKRVPKTLFWGSGPVPKTESRVLQKGEVVDRG